MNNPKEDDQYKLFIDSFNYIVLSVSFVESNVIWLKQDITTPDVWKYDRKKDKLYKWCNTGYDAVDMQYGFSKINTDDVWESRKQASVDAKSCDFIGFYGD